jgi:hypothetical protein
VVAFRVQFVEIWAELDPNAEERIPVKLLPNLIQKLNPPLGIKNKQTSTSNLMQASVPFDSSETEGFKNGLSRSRNTKNTVRVPKLSPSGRQIHDQTRSFWN